MWITCGLLGVYEGMRQALARLVSHDRREWSGSGRKSMDYIIAGIASLGLFIYLVYALLRPEKF